MRIITSFFLIIFFVVPPIFAQEIFPFSAKVKDNGINIRSDSRISSEAVCQVNKGEVLEVIQELYGWYKVRLPKKAPSFIRKDLLSIVPEEPLKTPPRAKKTAAAEVSALKARVIKERVNVRLRPSETAPILGKLNKDETVVVVKEEELWYRIEPPQNSYGWIYKDFMEPVPMQTIQKKKGKE